MTANVTENLAYLPGLTEQINVPVVNHGRQGDVYVVPAAKVYPGRTFAATTPIPRSGAIVVKGENGGNTHTLFPPAEGQAYFDALNDSGAVRLDIGVLVVEKDAVAYLGHPEHGYMGFEAGTYIVRRQREKAEAIRLVAD